MVMEISSKRWKNNLLTIDSPEQYQAMVENLEGFRSYLDEVIKSYPELLPPAIVLGYRFYGINYPKKQNLKIRRIQLLSSREVYQIRPEFIMPYMVKNIVGFWVRRFICRQQWMQAVFWE
jgi:hypothetical protein